MKNLPLEILSEILSYVSIRLIVYPYKTGHLYVLQRMESHPICVLLNEMIAYRWFHQDDYMSAYDEYFDDMDVLQLYQTRSIHHFVYTHFGVMFGFGYIHILCVKNSRIIHTSIQKYSQLYYGYMNHFITEKINLIKKPGQRAKVYYTKTPNEMIGEEKKNYMEYDVWIP